MVVPKWPDYYYDPEVQTGMQAYNKGMAYLLEQMEGMYITMAISLCSHRSMLTLVVSHAMLGPE